ncbi:glycoside hydrolase superfamily [Blakeslea trispora]|nr:glycoside hydrolase superfamily [Blakeslea trispora]
MSQERILLTPDIHANVLLSQHEGSTADFYCHSSVAYDIELWTNLSETRDWIGIPFTRQNKTDYSLKVSTVKLSPGDYEYTLRFRQNKNAVDWFWYGSIHQNGKIRVVPPGETSEPLELHQQLDVVSRFHVGNVYLQHFKLCSGGSFSVPLEIPHGMHSYVVLLRKGSCWITPMSGYHNFDHRSHTEQWQMLMYVDSMYGHVYLWTIASECSDCWFSPRGGNSISICHSSKKGSDISLLISSVPIQNDFSKLIPASTHYLLKETNHLNNIIQNSKSVFVDKLGYCTWNAFGKEVSLEKIHRAIESLAKCGIPIGYLMIDDGWQKVSHTSQLDGFDACPKKFPGGLGEAVKELKHTYPFLKYVGVWHALWGYWNGIDERFANTQGYAWSGLKKKNNSDMIGILTDPSQFFADFYHFLSKSGVNFIKVDNQGGFQDLDTGFNNMIQIWDDYRLSMSKNADQYLDSQIIHCMSFTPHILFHPKFSSVKTIFRNSDDFFPDEPESHTWHIYANTINALWSCQYPVIGDWDMFQSNHSFAEYHASSRALSGGPVYITDVPGCHDAQVIHRLIGETRRNGYRILRFSQAPLPTVSCMFDNPMENQGLISAFNTHHILDEDQNVDERYSVVGFWNTNSSFMKLGVVSLQMLYPDLVSYQAITFVVSGPDEGKFKLLYSMSNDFDELVIRIDKSSSTLVLTSQVRSTESFLVACLGLIDKFVGINAIKSTKQFSANQEGDSFDVFQVKLTHRSKCCAFWIKEKGSDIFMRKTAPFKVCLDGICLRPGKDWIWCSDKGLLEVDMTTLSLNSTESDEFCIDIYLKKI